MWMRNIIHCNAAVERSIYNYYYYWRREKNRMQCAAQCTHTQIISACSIFFSLYFFSYLWILNKKSSREFWDWCILANNNMYIKYHASAVIYWNILFRFSFIFLFSSNSFSVFYHCFQCSVINQPTITKKNPKKVQTHSINAFLAFMRHWALCYCLDDPQKIEHKKVLFLTINLKKKKPIFFVNMRTHTRNGKNWMANGENIDAYADLSCSFFRLFTLSHVHSSVCSVYNVYT